MNMESNYRTTPLDTGFYENADINYVAFIVQPTITYKHRGIRGTLQMPLNTYRYFGTSVANKLFFSPNLNINWEINSHWTIGAKLSLNRQEPAVNDSHTMPILVDYRTLRLKTTTTRTE